MVAQNKHVICAHTVGNLFAWRNFGGNIHAFSLDTSPYHFHITGPLKKELMLNNGQSASKIMDNVNDNGSKCFYVKTIPLRSQIDKTKIKSFYNPAEHNIPFFDFFNT